MLPSAALYMRMLRVGRHLEADRQSHLHMRSTSPVMVYARSGGELKRLQPKEAIRVPAVESSTSAAPLQPTADCDGAATLSGVQVNVVRADFAKFLQQHRQEWLVCELRHSDPCTIKRCTIQANREMRSTGNADRCLSDSAVPTCSRIGSVRQQSVL